MVGVVVGEEEITLGLSLKDTVGASVGDGEMDGDPPRSSMARSARSNQCPYASSRPAAPISRAETSKASLISTALFVGW